MAERDKTLLAEVAEACAKYALVRDMRSARGQSGDLLNQQAGSSVEFHEYRDYHAGDDLRHIDWKAYGRTRELMVRLFREEVSPRIEIIVDNSASMQIDDGTKAALQQQIPAFLHAAAGYAGSHPVVISVGDSIRLSHDGWQTEPSGQTTLFTEPQRVHATLRPHALRIIISDFMTTSSVSHALRILGRGAAQVVVLRLLGPWEAAPDAAGMATLTDAGDGRELPMDINAQALARYNDRMATIRRDLVSESARLAALALEIDCTQNLLDTLAKRLLPIGLVVPA